MTASPAHRSRRAFPARAGAALCWLALWSAGSAAAQAPPDTVLAGLCAGASGGVEAPGLLAVIFRAGTPDTAQLAAARAVGGSLAGTSPYGETYVAVPDSAGPLPVVADRLIRQDPVTTVSPVPCPTASAAAQAAPGAPAAPTAAAPGAAGVPPSAGAMRDSSRARRDSSRAARESAGGPADSTGYVPMKGP
jgi:hypothetical protein